MPYDPFQTPPGLNVPNSPMMPGSPQAPQAGQQNPYGLDPRVLEAMLGTYGDTLEMGALEKQLEQANALRETAMPEMRGNGRVQTAANPLEFIGAGIKQYKGMKKSKELEEGLGGIRKRIGENVVQGRVVPEGIDAGIFEPAAQERAKIETGGHLFNPFR